MDARRKRRPRRVIRVTVALVVLVVSLALLGGGALAAVAGSGGTYVDLGAHGSYGTDRYGLASDSTNWQRQFFGWAGSVRLQVAPAGRKPIFVGVAPADTLGVYLAGTGYTTVADPTGRGVVRFEHDGAAPALPDALAWSADAEGTGTQTLRWRATNRPQIVFAMNADRSRPVRVRVVSSAVTLDRMPWWVPAGALTLGVVLLATGVRLMRPALRPSRS